MVQANFAYDGGGEQGFAVGGVPLAVSIFAEHRFVQEQLREDVAAAGLIVRECGPLTALLDEDHDVPRALGEVVLLDCPEELNGGDLAALVRLDGRAARSGAQLIVSTNLNALEDVFACCDQSGAQILVSPSRADRIIALGGVMAAFANRRLRELSEDDRRTLLRLAEQVGKIAEQLDRFAPELIDTARSGSVSDDARAFNFNAPDQIGGAAAAYAAQSGRQRTRQFRPTLPDARLVRKIIHQRQSRARFFDADLFADPAWDMLLDLTAARIEHKRVSVTSLCIASGVPPTTALRWISQMTELGLLERVEDETDRRRAFIALTDGAVDSMARYFAEIEQGEMTLP